MSPKFSSAKKPAEQVVKDIRRATRRHFSAEDKIRIMPFLLGGSLLQILAGVVLGLLLMACSVPRGRIIGQYSAYRIAACAF